MLKEIINNLFNITNRDYEFEAELESHEMGNQNIYRLYYVDYRRCNERGSWSGNNVHKTDWPLEPFILPKNMSRKDAFKVLSYLIDFIEKKLNLDECSCIGVQMLNNVLNLERLGFQKLDIIANNNLDKIIDLHTIRGRILLFKQSEHYPRYVEWYTEGVTLEEVQNIYEKIGMEFHDLELINQKEKTKKLEMK